MKLKVNEIFLSINGEVNQFHQGSLCTFIRFQGCCLQCKWCDAPQAQRSNIGPYFELTPFQILKECNSLGCKNITITGGEPLMQNIQPVIDILNSNDYNISVETNGSLLPNLKGKVEYVVDYKLPSSGEEQRMSPLIFPSWEGDGTDFFLPLNTIIKFVVADKKDFMQALNIVDLMESTYPPNYLTYAFSPLPAVREALFGWMTSNSLLKRVGAVYSMQLHKILKVK